MEEMAISAEPDADGVRRRPTRTADVAADPAQLAGEEPDDGAASPVQPPGEEPNRPPAADGRRQRQRHRRRDGSGRLLTVGVLLSMLVSCLLGWQLLRTAGPVPAPDPAQLTQALSDALAAQPGVVNGFVRLVKQADSSERRRVDFLALGPPGTGKTLLTQTLAANAKGLIARRLVGGAEITRDLPAMDRLAADLLSVAPPGAWLLLALDDVSKYLPETVYVVEAVAEAAEKAGVRLITLVTATTKDVAAEKGADAERLAFRHAHVLKFRPLRRAGVAACLLRYAQSRGIALKESSAEAVAASVKYEGEYAVDGCKPALYHLNAALKLGQDAKEDVEKAEDIS